MTGAPERLARRGGAIELLRVPAALYSGITRLRSRLYDLRFLPRAKVDVPVISVGNLTVGGTGKTPFVLWLCEEFQRRGYLPGVLARGYGRAPGAELNDEGRLIAELCPTVAQIQDPDRVEGAGKLIEKGVDVVVLDDGFQHRRLERDLDFVLVDVTRPYGLPPSGGPPVAAVLPRGLLREPLAGLVRANAIVLTRVDALGDRALEALEEELREIAPGLPVIRTRHAPAGLRRLGATGREPATVLAGRPVLPLCAIGHPKAFLGTLHQLGALVEEPRLFPDHHRYTAEDLEGLVPPESGTEHPGRGLVVTTAKDAVKLADLELPCPVHVLDIELEICAGIPVLEALLDSLPEPGPARERRNLHAGLSG